MHAHGEQIYDSNRTEVHSYRIRSISPILILFFAPLVVVVAYKLALVRKMKVAAHKNKSKEEIAHPNIKEIGDMKVALTEVKSTGCCGINFAKSTPIETVHGRPQFEEYFSQFTEGTSAVFLCGPTAMCAYAHGAAIKECPTCEVHQETFHW